MSEKAIKQFIDNLWASAEYPKYTEPYYMKSALDEARKALRTGDVPVGAVAVLNSEIIARSHNEKEAHGDPLAHAEMICLRGTIEKIGWRRMGEVSFYVTLEPCAMCAGALVLCRVGTLIFGTADPKAGAAGSVMNVAGHPRLNHRLPITAGVMEKECAAVLTDFFKDVRRRKKSAGTPPPEL